MVEGIVVSCKDERVCIGRVLREMQDYRLKEYPLKKEEEKNDKRI